MRTTTYVTMRDGSVQVVEHGTSRDDGVRALESGNLMFTDNTFMVAWFPEDSWLCFSNAMPNLAHEPVGVDA
jgi:hypothetical protein